MAVINFAVPKVLQKRIDKTIKEKGFASKAEFFRFAAVQLLDTIQRPVASEDDRFLALTQAMKREIAKKYKGKDIPDVEKQLADL